jgi:hypothetical protein
LLAAEELQGLLDAEMGDLQTRPPEGHSVLTDDQLQILLDREKLITLKLAKMRGHAEAEEEAEEEFATIRHEKEAILVQEVDSHGEGFDFVEDDEAEF